jgi:hypothetical protein
MTASYKIVIGESLKSARVRGIFVVVRLRRGTKDSVEVVVFAATQFAFGAIHESAGTEYGPLSAYFVLRFRALAGIDARCSNRT